MRKNFIKFFILFLIVFISTKIVFAVSYSDTYSFGGKVIMAKIPGVTCDGDGFGPIELSSNIEGAISGTSSVLNSNNNTGQKIVGGVKGVYKMIPFYANDPTKKPLKGDYILGKAKIAPNLKICYFKRTDKDGKEKKIPYPVRETNLYSISGKSKNSVPLTVGCSPGGTLESGTATASFNQC